VRAFTLIAALALAACSGDSDIDSDAGDAAAGAEPVVSIGADTHLNPNPPVYETFTLPDGLVWETNDSDPVFTSPDAKRGGTFPDYWVGFPLTLRIYGPDANSGESVGQRRAMTSQLVEFHPNTLNPIPLMASHWAFDEDGRTVYYRLNPDARWSDGEPVVADDYLFTREMMLSEHVLYPYGQNYMTDVIVDMKKYDDYTISVTGAAALPRAELMLEYSVEAQPRHFHVLDENWVTDYNWRVEPVTGPYEITAIQNGQYIELTRRDDWWGNALKYNQNRYNAEKLRFEIIRDKNVAYEYFLRGELDRYRFDTLPARWHERAQGPDFDRGYINRIEFYNDMPRDQRGLWMNTDDPLLADRNVRLGLSHSINIELAIERIFRGDYQRMQIQHEGFFFGYSDTELRARQFDVDRAGEYFDAAGWSEFGPDGIRVRDGQRLSVRVSYYVGDNTPWLVVLREEARKAGVELNLQQLDSSTWGTQVGEKNFQITVLRFLPNTFAPSFWQGYHSANAHIPNTNNITNTDLPELDVLIDAYDMEPSLERRVELAHRIEAMIHEHAPMVPTYKIPFVRETYWRWVQLPEWYSVRTASEVFHPIGDEPYAVGGLFWIDEDIRAETLAARQEGRSLPRIDIVDTTWRDR
jgi:microcin C transport system substrate-binding protein